MAVIPMMHQSHCSIMHLYDSINYVVEMMDLLQRMRVIGSGLVIAAYFITLHLDVVTGVIVHLTAMSISVPYFIKSKAWDVVIMMSFLMTIGTGRLITSAIT